MEVLPEKGVDEGCRDGNQPKEEVMSNGEHFEDVSSGV
jgi:hypothetical protein